MYSFDNFFHYQILDDFNSLHSFIAKYACLEGKHNNIFVKWPSISKKLEQLIISQDDIVHYNDVKDFVSYLQNKDLSDGKYDARKFRLLLFLKKIYD